MNFGPATPELPVRDLAAAQEHYVTCFGFEIAWTNEAGRIGAVAYGDCGLFLRETDGEITPWTFWVYVDDVDAAYQTLTEKGAKTLGPPVDEPWGLRQFTVQDRDGHRMHMFFDP